ncbi:hypothetical protein Tco_0464697 [Tanacetum coccineum]
MSNLKFAETHNLVAFLDKPEENDGFEGIIDFLNASSIRYALTVNPSIYTLCIKQFWATAKAKMLMKKQPRRKQRKDIEVPQPSGSTEPITDEAANEEHVHIPMIHYLVERVRKLKRMNKSRTPGLKWLRKVGRYAQVVSSKDEDVLDEQEVKVQKVVSTAKVTTANATTTINELTLAQTLIEIKAAKPKAITTAATTTTTTVTRPKATGVAKDKGKAKMIELEMPLKKKDQILVDEEIAQRLQDELQAELEEEKRSLLKKREEDANIAEWDNISPLICTRIDSEVVKGDKEKDEGSVTRVEEISSKRASTELEQERIKKKKIDDDQEEAEMKKHMEIVVDEEEIAVDAIPLATKPSIIIDWKIIKNERWDTFNS